MKNINFLSGIEGLTYGALVDALSEDDNKQRQRPLPSQYSHTNHVTLDQEEDGHIETTHKEGFPVDEE